MLSFTGVILPLAEAIRPHAWIILPHILPLGVIFPLTGVLLPHCGAWMSLHSYSD